MNKEMLKNRAKLCAAMPLIIVGCVIGITSDFLRQVWYGVEEGWMEIKDGSRYSANLVKRTWNWKPENEVKK